jgi:transposase-like protein
MAANGNKRERAALALASGLSVRRAARECSVGARTIHRWLEKEPFRHRIQELRTEMFTCAVGRLSRVSGKAAGKLKGLLDSEDERIRLAAAKTILETGMKAREMVDLLDRVDTLEKRALALGNLKH